MTENNSSKKISRDGLFDIQKIQEGYNPTGITNARNSPDSEVTIGTANYNPQGIINARNKPASNSNNENNTTDN